MQSPTVLSSLAVKTAGRYGPVWHTIVPVIESFGDATALVYLTTVPPSIVVLPLKLTLPMTR